MYSSDLGFFLGPLEVGQESGSFESTACLVDVSRAIAEYGDVYLVLKLPVRLRPAMAGRKKIFLRSHDVLGRDSGWRQAGEWTIPSDN
jgi:hypothetical protein